MPGRGLISKLAMNKFGRGRGRGGIGSILANSRGRGRGGIGSILANSRGRGRGGIGSILANRGRGRGRNF
jgi:hypothetical protein